MALTLDANTPFENVELPEIRVTEVNAEKNHRLAENETDSTPDEECPKYEDSAEESPKVRTNDSYSDGNNTEDDISLPSDFKDDPKALVSEIDDILSSLSDDERFLECVNFSNPLNDYVKIHEKRTSVDMIFTYNVLSTLYNKLKELKSHFVVVQSRNERLEAETQRTEAQHMAYQVHSETLEKTIDAQQQELSILSDKLAQYSNSGSSMKENYARLENELNALRNRYEMAVAEKERVVMTYVHKESDLLKSREERDRVARRLREVERERDDLAKRTKTLAEEKAAAGRTLDVKRGELSAALKEVERLKEEVRCADIKSKWVDQKMKTELATYEAKEADLKAQITKLEEKINQFESDERVESEKIEIGSEPDSEEIIMDAASDLKQKQLNLIEENNALSLKVQKLETKRLEYDGNLMNLKQTIENQNQKISELQNKIVEMDSLRNVIKQQEDKLTSFRNEIERLREANDDLRADMEICREREAELLAFTEKLTAKNVSLQSEYTAMEAKKISLEEDRLPIENKVTELEENISRLKKQLKNEIEQKTNENKLLSEKLQEKSAEIESLNTRLEEQQAENQSLTHKYTSKIRELSRELQQCKKMRQADNSECSSNDSACLDSRTSSCNSLNETQLFKMDVDKQSLIDRILKLQNQNAKHVEKIEFLEEHVSQLLKEVKRKTRVLQHYIMREQSGALSSDLMDQNKSEMIKHGGIMASLYSSKFDDSTISHELSLEINRKLQAVLEDTLLKNITLKENLETLGREIDRLTSSEQKPRN